MRAPILIALIITIFFGASEAIIYGEANVIDGDSLIIDKQRIRLHGIDAVEKKQKCITDENIEWQCGLEAKNFLVSLIGENKVLCFKLSHDKYKRKLSRCFNHHFKDLSAEMVLHGYATAYKRYSTKYIEQEQIAKEAHVGIWSGTFENPEQYRKNKRAAAAQ